MPRGDAETEIICFSIRCFFPWQVREGPGRCQWPLPRNGDVLRNQFFFLFRFVLPVSGTRVARKLVPRLFVELRAGKHSEASPCSLSDTPRSPAAYRRRGAPSPPRFRGKICIRGGVRQTPVLNSVIYFAYVCWRRRVRYDPARRLCAGNHSRFSIPKTPPVSLFPSLTWPAHAPRLTFTGAAARSQDSSAINLA